MGYVGMLQCSDNLPFMAEAAQQISSAQRRVHEFDRHLFTVLAIHSFGKIDCAHPTAADLALDFIWSQTPSGKRFGEIFAREIAGQADYGTIQKFVIALIGCEQGCHLSE